MLDSNLSVTVNTTGESIEIFIFDPIFIIALVICVCTGFWTICMHGLLILCFYLNMNLDWVKQAKGTLSLIITDFFSGVAFLLLLKAQTSTSVPRYACFLPTGFYMTTQLLTSLQILRICVDRLMITLKNTKQHRESTRRTVVQFVGLHLVSAAAVCINLSWIHWQDNYPMCTLSGLAGENMEKACVVMLLTLSVPNMVTTCLYFSIIYVLKPKYIRVWPDTQKTDTSKGRGPTKETEITVISLDKEIRSDLETSKEYSYNRAIKKYWRAAVVNIGIILFLNNISQLPYICVLSYQIARGVNDSVPAYMWYGAGFCLQTNSALSPFIYCLRVKAIKIAFWNMLKKVFCRCKV